MTETSVIWLRVAVVLYSLGLFDAIFVLTRRRDSLFRTALAAFGVGGLFHLVSLVEEGLLEGHFPVTDLYETMSLCAFLVTALFLFVYWRYRAETLSVIIFPLVFVMALVASLGKSVPHLELRNAWLVAHIVFSLLGYAALLFTATAAVVYLWQEHELKRKRPRDWSLRLPPLGTLDDLISSSLAVGFAFVTIGLVIGSIWACAEFGTRWITDPRIGISLLTWCIYLAMVFLRASAGWRGRKAAILAITALFCSAVTWVAHKGLFIQ